VNRVYTIGHSNRPVEHFVGRLRRHGIITVFDVRSRPFSRHSPQFDRYPLCDVLFVADIDYVWKGHSLGGMPDDRSLWNGDRPNYAAIRASEMYRLALHQLVERDLPYPEKEGPIVLMCSEQDPSGCHRRVLVGADLVEHGYELMHIMGDGEMASEHQVRESTGENQPSVIDLLGS
jgi:uncharacterized protein (DUF488 family)